MTSTGLPLRRCLPAALLAALILAGCAAPQDGGTQNGARAGGNEGLRSVLQDVRNHPENRAASEVYCLLSITQGDSDFPYQLFFAGLFSVDREDGTRAFCAAMVEAVIAGELTEADLAPFDRPSSVRGKEPLGTLLRKLMVAHLRLETQEAAAPPPTTSTGPQPPQS